MKVHTDCLHFLGDRPCATHKEKGIRCESCEWYEPIRSRILIIKLGALGDVLRTTSILPALRAKYPRAAVTWVTRRNALPLLKNNPGVWKSLAVEENYLEYLLNQSFHAAFCLDAEPLAATLLSLCRTLEKYGFCADEFGAVAPANEAAKTWYYLGLNDTLKRENRRTFFEHLYDICHLAPPIHLPQYALTPAQLERAQSFKEAHGLGEYRFLLGLNTGAGRRWELKKWRPSSIISLIESLRARRPDIGILLYGGPDEVEDNDRIIKAVGAKVVDAGCHNSLDDFAALISLCDLFLTPDSLGMHFSVAMGKPTLVLVGPTSPWELDVFGKGEIIFAPLPCLACYKNRCSLEENCMTALTPELVLEKILKFF